MTPRLLALMTLMPKSWSAISSRSHLRCIHGKGIQEHSVPGRGRRRLLLGSLQIMLTACVNHQQLQLRFYWSAVIQKCEFLSLVQNFFCGEPMSCFIKVYLFFESKYFFSSSVMSLLLVLSAPFHFQIEKGDLSLQGNKLNLLQEYLTMKAPQILPCLPKVQGNHWKLPGSRSQNSIWRPFLPITSGEGSSKQPHTENSTKFTQGRTRRRRRKSMRAHRCLQEGPHWQPHLRNKRGGF